MVINVVSSPGEQPDPLRTSELVPGTLNGQQVPPAQRCQTEGSDPKSETEKETTMDRSLTDDQTLAADEPHQDRALQGLEAARIPGTTVPAGGAQLPGQPALEVALTPGCKGLTHHHS